MLKRNMLVRGLSLIRLLAAVWVALFLAPSQRMSGQPGEATHPGSTIARTVTFTCLPAHLQLFPRGTDDSAAVTVAGRVVAPGYDSVVVEVFRSNVPWKSTVKPLEYQADGAPFGIETKIHAEASEYHFVVRLSRPDQTIVVATIDSVVCGDVYLITGQSNSHPSDPHSTYSNEFCRSFGVQTPDYNYDPYNPADTLWGLANGHGFGNVGCGPLLTGVWGMRLQQLLLENYGVPTCIINGGSGGSTISYNLRNESNPMDLNTAYGRMLYRATKAHVADKARAFFWYQGENDSNDSVNVQNYPVRFRALYESWAVDYPNIREFYVFQINLGCTSPADSSYGGKLREVMRRFPETYPNLSTLSTFGIEGHAGCHFTYEGYNRIGDNVFRVVARDFFGSPDTTDVLPPNIVKATYSDSLRTTLTLEFQNTAEIVWPADTLIAGMEDYFYLDGMSGQVVAGAASGNRVTLMLSSSGRARTVTYLPDRYYTNTNQVYEGPFITNLRGIGGLSFDEFPIDSDVVIAGLPSPNNTVSPSFYLYQNYPNPFNPTTTIIYRVTARSLVNLMVFDLLGRQVATLVNETKDRGEYQATWDATTFAGGVYFYHLWADGQSQSKKLVLLK